MLIRTGEKRGLVENFSCQKEIWKEVIYQKKEGEWRSKEEYLLYLRHLKAYDFALKYVQGKSVLDVGCGSGYGTALLSKFSSHAIGIDISEELIRYSRKRWKRRNLEFRHVKSSWVGDGLPFDECSFDVCVSFQVIEHIHPKNIEGYLLGIKKILKEGGIFVVSTPNSRLRLLPFQKPWNRFHMKEYDYKELGNLFRKKFSKFEMFGLYGNKKAYMTEYKRVKQSPLNVYIVRPSYRLFKFLPPSLRMFLKNLNIKRRRPKRYKVRRGKDDSFLELFSLKDLKVVKPAEKNLRSCLDLVCVCYK